MWENHPRGDLFAHHRVRIEGISGKQSKQNLWRTWSGCYIQYWSCWEQRVAGEGLRCNAPNVGKSPEGAHVCPPQSQFPMDFWQTEDIESMENTFLMLYPVLGLLGAKGRRWDAEMEGPNVGKSPERGSVCPLRSHIWEDLWPTQWMESMENMFLMLYPVLESLRANGGRCGQEMHLEISPKPSKISQVGKDL